MNTRDEKAGKEYIRGFLIGSAAGVLASSLALLFLRTSGRKSHRRHHPHPDRGKHSRKGCCDQSRHCGCEGHHE